jgi:K+-sensing histidine kinase KdpD
MFISFCKISKNLVSNALGYSTSGPQVKIEVNKSDLNLEVNVIDQGPGISEHEKESLM